MGKTVSTVLTHGDGLGSSLVGGGASLMLYSLRKVDGKTQTDRQRTRLYSRERVVRYTLKVSLRCCMGVALLLVSVVLARGQLELRYVGPLQLAGVRVEVVLVEQGTNFEPSLDAASCLALPVPEDWDVRRALLGDLTGEARPLCTLLLWRPWRDVATSRWSWVESSVARYRDAAGESAHIALLEPSASNGYREVWVASALPQPATDMLVADLTGDGGLELVLLETSYQQGREGAGEQVSVWRWNGFSFTLLARTEAFGARRVLFEREGVARLLLLR